MSKKVTDTPAAEGAVVSPAPGRKAAPSAEAVAKYERGRVVLLNLQRAALELAELGLSGISSHVLAAASKLARVRPRAGT